MLKQVDAYGLMERITDSTFIACFQTILHYFGYLRGISSMLQGSTLDVLEGHQMVSTVKSIKSLLQGMMTLNLM